MWWLIGTPFVAWGVYAVILSFVEMEKDPSVGGAAMIATILGVLATVLGLFLIWLLW